MQSSSLDDEVLEGDLIDPEDVPLGQTVWICRRTDFGFDARSGAAESIVLATGIDASEFVSGQIVAILHDKNSWADGTALVIVAQAVSLDPLEPEVEFVGDGVNLTILFKDEAPRAFLTPLGVLPAMLRVVVSWQQGDNATALQTASISVALNLRRHVAPRYVVTPRRSLR